VLSVRWEIYTLAGRHDCALPIAEALIKLVHGLGRTMFWL
jgi:hypothetical protein